MTVREPFDEVRDLSPLAKAVWALKKTRGQLEALRRSHAEPIAVVGAACRFPGAPDLRSFWELLERGEASLSEVPPDRWDIEATWDPDPDAPGKMYVRSAGFLPDVASFDARFFGIAPREAAQIDPQQRLLLEVAWEALENAAIPPGDLFGTATGVFVGIMAAEYAHLQALHGDPARQDGHSGVGSASSVAAGRLAYVLGLTGPAMAIDTACSSGLVALHLAVQSLRAGECRTALVGGVNVILAPTPMILACRARMLAPDGRCKTFDAAADGFGRGEGCGVVVLRRLSDALESGDRVLAVVRGSAVNQDGRSGGLTAPNGPAQAAVIRQALAAAGVSPDEIGMVEAHGTGTPLGDPIEMGALVEVFGTSRRERPLFVGSVKTNVGHLEAAAGLSALLKTVEALRHRTAPPHLHLERLNPRIAELGIDRVPIEIPREALPLLPIGGRRLAGVSSFGFSGTNVHVVLEEPPSAAPAPGDLPAVVPLSARSPGALRALAARWAESLSPGRAEGPPPRLADVAFTAAAGRTLFPHRAAIVASTVADLRERLASLARGDEGPAPSGAPAHLEEAAASWRRGQAVDLASLVASADPRRVELPSVVFERERLWIDLPASLAAPAALTHPGLLHAVRWQAAPVVPSVAVPRPGRWLVLGPGGEPLALHLRERGVDAESSPGMLPPRGAEGETAGVVLLAPEGSGDPARAAAEIAGTVLAALRALLGRPGEAPKLFVVAREGLAASVLRGLAKVLFLEHPEVRGGLVELGPGGEGDDGLGLVAAHLLAGDGETEVRVAGGVRQVARLERLSAPPARLVLPPDATVLVTGGLGALGLAIARRLVERGARSLVLVGRRGVDELPDATRAAVASLGDSGATVWTRRADVSSPGDVGRILEEIRAGAPPLDMVVHAAGALADAVLLRTGPEALAAAFAPKVAGAWNLHEATQTTGLSRFVLLSSAAAVLGSPGQAAYAAANAFLDGLARSRREEGLPATSLAFGPWAGEGMARDLSRVRPGPVTPLEPARALDAFEEVLAAGNQLPPDLSVLDADWASLSRETSLASGPVSRLPSILRGLAGGESREKGSPLPEELGRLDGASRAARLGDIVRKEVARVLGLAPGEVDARRGFADSGMDSLLAIDLKNALQALLGIPLAPTVAINHPTVETLATHLDGILFPEGTGAPVPSGQAVLPAEAPRGDDPIAVVGIGCRFPSGSGPDLEGPGAFWEFLAEGGDAVSEVPKERWDPATDGGPRFGAFLSGVDLFDASFFGISPREAEVTDPQQRLLLEVAWEALEDAGLPADGLRRSATGVFVGIDSTDYARVVARAAAGGAEVDSHVGTGNSLSVAAGRISFVLGFHGPTMAVDTACSSSLVAVHLAAESLRRGECTLALAGGVNVILTPETSSLFEKAGMLARDGHCKTFDGAADGYVRGEGCALLVLERLSVATARGDRVLALIRGSAVNHDGPTSGLTVPSAPAQEALLRGALRAAGVAPSAVGYLEAHGTGTPLGDPIEMEAIGAVLGAGRSADDPLLVGSVKTNLGHLEPAAGVAGLVKTVLALAHRAVPPHRNFSRPSPFIDWERLPVRIPTALEAWEPRSKRRIAGVSAFGLSGTNAHVVVEEGPGTPFSPAAEPLSRPVVLPLSARDPGALRDQAARWADLLERGGEGSDLPSVAFTAATGRAGLPFRAAVVATCREEAVRALRGLAGGTEAPGLVVDGEPRDEGDGDGDGDGDGTDAARTAAEAFVRGESPDWAPRFAGLPVRKVALPTYPFRRRRHWIQAPAAGQGEVRRAGGHPLIGHRVSSPALEAVVFEALLGASDPSFLADHVVQGLVIVSGPTEMTMAVEAVRSALLAEAGIVLEEVLFEVPLVLSPGIPRTVQTILSAAEAGGWRFEIVSRGNESGWVRHASGSLRVEDGEEETAPAAGASAAGEKMSGTSFYADVAPRFGFAFGPAYRWIEEVERGTDEAGARMRPATAAEAAPYLVPPGLFDSAFQLSMAVLADEGGVVPMAVRRAVFHGRAEGALGARVTIERAGGSPTPTGASVALHGADGRAVVSVEGIRGQPATRERLTRALPATPGSIAPGRLRARLGEVSPAERRGLLELLVREEVARVLRLESPATLDPRRPLFEAGLDSLLAIELRNALQDGLAVPLPSTVVFDGPSVSSLAEALAAMAPELAGAVAPAGGAAAMPATIAETAATSATAAAGAGGEAERLSKLSPEEMEALLLAKLSSLEGGER